MHQAYRSGDRRPGADRRIYKKHFGLTELYRRPTDTGDKGVWLSDGYIYFAILNTATPTHRKSGRSRPPTCAASTISASRWMTSRDKEELESAGVMPVRCPRGASARRPRCPRITRSI